MSFFLSLSLFLFVCVCNANVRETQPHNEVYCVWCLCVSISSWRDRLRKITRIKYVPVTQSISIEFKWNVETANECLKKSATKNIWFGHKHDTQTEIQIAGIAMHAPCSGINFCSFFLGKNWHYSFRYDTSRDDLDCILVHSSIIMGFAHSQFFFSLNIK